MSRRLIGTAIAFWFFVISRGRITGGPFILRRITKLSVEPGGKLTIGRNVMIDAHARIVVRDHLVIGDDVFIGKNSTLVAYAHLSLGQGVLLGENVSIHTEDHGPAGARNNFVCAPVSVGSESWIGAGCVVTKGVSIGSRATVGANAVVVKDIPDGATAVGIPARVIKVD